MTTIENLRTMVRFKRVKRFDHLWGDSLNDDWDFDRWSGMPFYKACVFGDYNHLHTEWDGMKNGKLQ